MGTRSSWSARTVVAVATVVIGAWFAIGGASTVGADEAATSAARERLADVLASDSVDRIEFVAVTFDDAMARIYATVDELLGRTADRFDDPGRAADFASEVILAFNSHDPRGLAMTFLEGKSLEVADTDDAVTLGALLGAATVLVRDHLGPDASAEVIRPTAVALFRGVVLDPDGGLGYLEQYLQHVETVAQMPASQRARFFEVR